MRNRSYRDELSQSITSSASLDDVTSFSSSKYLSSSQLSSKSLHSNGSGRKRRRQKGSLKCSSLILSSLLIFSFLLFFVFQKTKDVVSEEYLRGGAMDQPSVRQIKVEGFVDDTDEEALWVGRISDERKKMLKSELTELNEKIEVTLVIAHCDLNLQWIWSDFVHDMTDDHFEIKEIYIYTKCSKPVKGIPPHVEKMVKIKELPNVGRNDHSFAFHINHSILPHINDSDKNGIILFLKDNPYRLKWNPEDHDDYYVVSDKEVRSFQDLLYTTWVNGFGCAEQALLMYGILISNYHVSEHVGWFSMKDGYVQKARDLKEQHFASKYIDMENWLQEQLGVVFRKPYTPVCYGGTFATTTKQIRLVHESIPTLFENLVTSLERGNNIEEGHFCERAWAPLLTKGVSEKAVSILNSKRTIEKCFQMPWTDRCGIIGYFSKTHTQKRDDDDWNGVEIEEYVKNHLGNDHP